MQTKSLPTCATPTVVGHSNSLQILGNRLTLSRPADGSQILIDGIRLLNRFGRHAVIRDNYLSDYDLGV